MAAHLLGRRCDAGNEFAVLRDRRQVAATKISACPGTVRSGSTGTRPLRSSVTPSDCATGDAATPAAQTTVRAGTNFPPSR
jgi:hypothetical protein